MKQIMSSIFLIVSISVASNAEMALKQMVFADSYIVDRSLRSPAVKVLKEADYVSTNINLFTDKAFKDSTLEELKQDINLIRQRVAENKKFSIYSGPIKFRVQGKVALNASQSQLTLMAKLGTNGFEDALTAGAELRSLYEDVKKNLKTGSSIDNMKLALSDPDQYRNEILKKLAAEVRQTKEIFNGKAKITVTKVEGPVEVQQIDDMHLELFINYDMSMEIVD